MKLQRYQDEYSGCEPNPEGQYVALEDVIRLLEQLADKLDDPEVLYELEDCDLSGSILVDEYIRDNKDEQ